jgi:hypothetical protein
MNFDFGHLFLSIFEILGYFMEKYNCETIIEN